MAIYIALFFDENEVDHMLDYIQCLKEENLSCIIEQNGQIYKETAHGILPILNNLDQGKLFHAHVTDRVIGKAAAMIMVYGHVQSVKAMVISEPALAFFQAHQIPITYEEKVPYIINRKNDGMCPMEETVLHVEDVNMAYHLLVDKVQQLKNISQ